MYLVQYHRESQIQDSKVISDDEGQFDAEYDEVTNTMQVGDNPLHVQKEGMLYQCGGSKKYLVYLEDTMNFDHTIIDQMNYFVINEVNILESKLSSFNLLDYMKDYALERKIKSDVVKEPICQSINLGTN